MEKNLEKLKLKNKNKKFFTNKKTNSGITLIALVITIIVLLILAGISISMLSGDNGILQKAGDAKELTGIGQEKESVSLAYNSVIIDKTSKGDTSAVTGAELDTAIKTYDAGASAEDDDNQIIVTFENGHKYSIDSDGVIVEYTPPSLPLAKNKLIVNLSGSTDEEKSPYVNYRYEDSAEPILCRVLYNDETYGIQIIAINPVKSVKLGTTDDSGKISGRGSTKVINSYNRAILTLNEYALLYLDTDDASGIAIDARCVGSIPNQKNAESTANTYSGVTLINFDNNYTDDEQRLKDLESYNISDNSYGEYYWLASRCRTTPTSGMYAFGLKRVKNTGTRSNYCILSVSQGDGVSIYGTSNHNGNGEFGLRPIFIINQNAKIISGKGTIDNPYELSL